MYHSRTAPQGGQFYGLLYSQETQRVSAQAYEGDVDQTEGDTALVIAAKLQHRLQWAHVELQSLNQGRELEFASTRCDDPALAEGIGQRPRRIDVGGKEHRIAQDRESEPEDFPSEDRRRMPYKVP